MCPQGRAETRACHHRSARSVPGRFTASHHTQATERFADRQGNKATHALGVYVRMLYMRCSARGDAQGCCCSQCTAAVTPARLAAFTAIINRQGHVTASCLPYSSRCYCYRSFCTSAWLCDSALLLHSCCCVNCMCQTGCPTHHSPLWWLS